MSATPRVEAVKHLSPHPEEAAPLGGRLEGWIHGTRSRACPTSARRSPKSATADFGCSLPSFETRASFDKLRSALLRMRSELFLAPVGWARFALPTLPV